MAWQQDAIAEINTLVQSGQWAKAQDQGRKLLQRDRTFADGWFVMSKLAQLSGHVPNARKLIETALKLEPGNVRFLAHQAYLLSISLETSAALELLTAIEPLAADHAAIWADIGNAYNACGELAKAHAAFNKADQLDPGNPDHEFNLAMSLKHMGKFDEAEAYANRVLAQRPDDYELYEFRSSLKKQTPASNHIDALEALLAAGKAPPKGETQIAYALAKEYEDLGDLPSAFANYSRAASVRRKVMTYDVKGDVEALGMITEVYSKDFFEAAPGDGYSNSEPIFILGLPRTGTTLLERIIAGHPDVFAAGELQNFQNELVRAVNQLDPNQKRDKFSTIHRAVEVDHSALGKAYLDSIKQRRGQAPHFIDKLPLNYLYVGAIARALPDAKIIQMHRHPMDAAFAIFKTLFTQAYPFSYDLCDLGHYYVAYRRLIDHWQDCLGDRLIHVHYEHLVTNTDSEARRIIQALGFPWNDACLDFHASRQPTNTASAVQVREKVYTSSVEKWRLLEVELDPFRTILEQAGIDVS